MFVYEDTASSRAGLGMLAEQLKGQVVAIIGCGGTGSYILDLLAKMPVAEIRLIDGDDYMQHNAFRAPGAASRDTLESAPKKVDHFARIYGQIHANIVPHAVYLRSDTANLLEGVTSAFIAVDSGAVKRLIVDTLEAQDAIFLDVGMGLELTDGHLGGILRTTISVPGRRQAFHDGRICYSAPREDDVYDTNIQTVDLNALNACFAVVRWKKALGFYSDMEAELRSSYTTDGNQLENGDELC